MSNPIGVGKKFGAIQDDFKPLHPYLWNNSYKVSGMEEIRRVLSQANTLINVSSVVFRREAIPDFSSVLRYKFAGDWELYLRMCREGNIFFEREATNYFRRSSGAQTSRTVFSDLFYREHNMIMRTVNEIAGAEAASKTATTIRKHWAHQAAPGKNLNEYLSVE